MISLLPRMSPWAGVILADFFITRNGQAVPRAVGGGR
jgi:purine-cytosine permease-like protein